MIFVDGAYQDNQGHSQVETIELRDLDWDDVKECILDLFTWEVQNDRYIDYVEVWDEDNEEEPLVHYTRERALEVSNPTMKRCKSIWKTV